MDEVDGYLISILLPIGSKRPWLEACLHSINEASNGLKTELVIVLNNLSPSETLKIKSIILSLWERPIKIVSKESKNLAEILNAGILNCSGQFIARIDDDDLMLVNRLHEQLHAFIQNPRLVLVGSATQVINVEEEKIRNNFYPTSHNEIIKALRFGNSFAHSSVMMSKEALYQVGLYSADRNLAEDYHLWSKLSRIGSVMNINHPLISYRLSDSQLNSRHKEIQINSVKDVVMEIYKNEIETNGTIPTGPLSFRISVLDRLNFNSHLISRQYFAIARLHADSKYKWNRRTLSYLILSFFVNPQEFVRMSNVVINKRRVQAKNP